MDPELTSTKCNDFFTVPRLFSNILFLAIVSTNALGKRLSHQQTMSTAWFAAAVADVTSRLIHCFGEEISYEPNIVLSLIPHTQGETIIMSSSHKSAPLFITTNPTGAHASLATQRLPLIQPLRPQYLRQLCDGQTMCIAHIKASLI